VAVITTERIKVLRQKEAIGEFVDRLLREE
jgi:hypothetical protein